MRLRLAVVGAGPDAAPHFQSLALFGLCIAHGVALAFMNGKTLTRGTREASCVWADPMDFDHGAHRTALVGSIRAIQNATAPTVIGRSASGVQRATAIITTLRTGRTVWLDPT